MGQSLVFFVIAIAETWFAYVAAGPAPFDMGKIRGYNSSSSLTAPDFLKYLKAMDYTVKDGHWAIEGDIVKKIRVFVGKNKDNDWQIDILAHFSSDQDFFAREIIFEPGLIYTEYFSLEGRNYTQTFQVGANFITREIKLDNGLESTQTLSFDSNGEMMTVSMLAKAAKASLQFKRDPTVNAFPV